MALKTQSDDMTDAADLLKGKEEIWELKMQNSILRERWESLQRETASLKAVKSWHKGVLFSTKAATVSKHFFR